MADRYGYEVSVARVQITERHGVFWANDGREVMAGAVPERLHRFFRNGIAARRHKLTGRYLRGLVPINPGAVVVNFGANIGEVAVTLAELGASVVAIEPDPNVIPALAGNAAGRLIDVVDVAAWDTDGVLDIYVSTQHADTSAFEPPADRSSHRRTVPCWRIDTLTRERGIDHVHLIVGDAEGGEPEVLRGASRILGNTDYVSVCASAERGGESTLEACEALLLKEGFDILCRETTGFCTLIGKSGRL